jgi:hypothetical protein
VARHGGGGGGGMAVPQVVWEGPGEATWWQGGRGVRRSRHHSGAGGMEGPELGDAMVGPCSGVVWCTAGNPGRTKWCGGMAGGYRVWSYGWAGGCCLGFCIVGRTCKRDVLPVRTAFYSSMPSGVSLGVRCVAATAAGPSVCASQLCGLCWHRRVAAGCCRSTLPVGSLCYG